jgi:hypothetical protein
MVFIAGVSECGAEIGIGTGVGNGAEDRADGYSQ